MYINDILNEFALQLHAYVQYEVTDLDLSNNTYITAIDKRYHK